jgi:hypothetical protein
MYSLYIVFAVCVCVCVCGCGCVCGCACVRWPARSSAQSARRSVVGTVCAVRSDRIGWIWNGSFELAGAGRRDDDQVRARRGRLERSFELAGGARLDDDHVRRSVELGTLGNDFEDVLECVHVNGLES